MCLQPIQIINKTRRYLPHASKVFQTVPCGNCSDCKSRQQDDWYIRAFFEWKRCKDKGGATWFPTLTYDDEHLPHYSDEDFSFPCFSYNHILRFRKILRQSLKRYLFNSAIDKYKRKNSVKRVPLVARKSFNSWACNLVQGVRFVVCSEFGGDKGRPHYHALLFLPFYIKFIELRDILQNKCWPYGLVRWSIDESNKRPDMFKPIVESSRGIKYVMKYISKDDTWSDKYNLMDYKEYLKELGDKDKFLDFKRSSPRHYQSTYFGIDGISMFKKGDGYDVEKVSKDTVSLISLGAAPDSKGREFHFRVPLYYIKKMCYDYDKDTGLYSLNDFGKDVYCHKFQARFNFTCKYFEEWLQSRDVFISKMFGIDIWKYASPKNVVHMFQTKGEIYDYIQELMKGRSSDLLSLYSCLYQGLAPSDYRYMKLLSFEEQQDLLCSGQYVAKTLNDIINSDFKSVEYEKGDSEYEENPQYLHKSNCYGNLLLFDGFDYVLSIIHSIEKCIGLARRIGKYVKDTKDNNSKCVINKIRFGHV